MKRVFLITGFLLPLLVLLFSSSSQSVPQNPKIGTFELYRTINESDIVSYFGNYSLHNEAKNENENGEDVKMDSYYYYYYNETNTKKLSLAISIMEDRLEGFEIKKRDQKYAINGKLMIGDNISKVSELGYEVKDKYGESCKIVNLPIYRRGSSEIYYYFEIDYDANNLITRIALIEDTGQ